MSQCNNCNIKKSGKGCTGLCVSCFYDKKGIKCKECGKSIYSVKYMLCVACYKRYIEMGPLKIKCHDILGWECVCCGRNDINHLEFDHKIPVKGKHVPLKQTYDEIISMGSQASEKYQILCRFCNISKKRNDKCPVNHKYDLNNLREAIEHMKELGIKDLDNIKIPETI